ncbi:MAG: 8-oxo-dGTP diphosphatase MutT [Bacillota bacterium]
MNTIIVIAAVIENRGSVLITQRKKDVSQGLKWEFPGGKLEDGEAPEECIVREIKEELNIEIEVNRIIKAVNHRYSERNILLLAYLCRQVGGVPMTLDCESFSWVPVRELMKYDLAEADIPIAIYLQEVLGNGDQT